MTESVKQIADLIITKTDDVAPDGNDALKINIVRANGKFIIETVIVKNGETDDFTESKALVAAWLGLGLFTPLADRIESLAEHGLSKSAFMVSQDGIEVARAYRELTGKDITEAI